MIRVQIESNTEQPPVIKFDLINNENNRTSLKTGVNAGSNHSNCEIQDCPTVFEWSSRRFHLQPLSRF